MTIDPADENIPTLTDIVSAGDESMKNHFDASYFDEPEKRDEPEVNMDTQAEENPVIEDPFTISSDLDTGELEVLEENMPSIEPEVAVEPEHSFKTIKLDSEELHSTIEALIDDALKKTLPAIEDQLKQQLSETIIDKLSEDLKN